MSSEGRARPSAGGSGAPGAQAEPDRRAWVTLVIASVAGFMVSLEITVIALAFPQIREAFPGASISLLSWVFTAYSIGVAALLLVSGYLADRVGRRQVFLAGVVVFAVGSLLSGLAPSAPLLIAGRVVQSVGGAMQFPSGLALVLDAFPPHRRQGAIGIWGASASLAAALGPTAGALLVQGFGWRAVFLINVPVAVAAVVVGWRQLPRSAPGAGPRGVDLISVPLASVAVGCLVLAVVEGGTWGWGSARLAAVVALAVVLLGLFLWRSNRHPTPLFDLGLFRVRSFAVATGMVVLFAAAFFAWLVPLPTYVQGVWGYSVLAAGFAIAPGPLLSAIVSPVAGRWADRVGHRPLLVVCGASGTAGMLAHVTFTRVEADLLLGLIVPGLLMGVCAGTGFAMLVGAAMRDVPPARFGMAGAGRTTVFQMAIAFGIAIGTAIIGEPVGGPATLAAYQRLWLVGAWLLAAFGVLALFLYPAGVVLRPAGPAPSTAPAPSAGPSTQAPPVTPPA